MTTLTEPAPRTKTTPAGSTSFADAHFAATHNSYSGNLAGGQRGSFPQQLDGGVRFLELDINVEDFASVGDYLVGHGWPGRQVDHSGGNPQNNLFSDWVELIANWLRQNPSAAPITLGVDVKNDLYEISSPTDGNLSALNALLAESLGTLLVTAEELGDQSWPSVDALRGRVLAVLSGNQGSRKAYLATQGSRPSVAINDQRLVVAVFQSPSKNELWYWTGQMQDNGSVVWLATGQYDHGITPAVAVNNQGVVVEVHQSQNNSDLWSRVGQVDDKGVVTWGDSQKFASGSLPSVEFETLDSVTVEEIHVGSSGDQSVTGTADPSSLAMTWGSAAPTTSPRFPTANAQAGSLSISVSTGTDTAGTPDTLFYGTGSVQSARIRYRQLFFVEYQKKDGTSSLANENLWFYASGASDWPWGSEQRQNGKIVRLWDFDEDDTGGDPPVNFGATNTPDAPWYLSYCQEVGVIT